MERRKNPQNSSSNNNHLIQISEFNYLPPEIWTQILENLPAKTLLKFRCVCKSWCSIIDNPDFIHIHLQISQISNFGVNNRSLVALNSLGYLGNREIGYLLTHRHPETLRKTGLIFRNSDLYSYRMIGSCNGLILVSRIESPRSMQKKLRLWNPCIRKSLVIPDSPFSPSLHANAVYLFGYASVSKDYKVVALAKEKGVGQRTRKMYVTVYTLRDQRWTARHDWLNVGIPNAIEMSRPSYCLSAAVSLKGVAYWLGKVDKNRNELSHICSFDFNKEEISFVELPSSWDKRGSCRFLFLLGKSLAIFRISKVASSIWVLDQDNKNGPWTQRFSGKSSQDGYELFRFFYLNQKLFFCESDGGYFIRGNKSYNIASCEVQEYKGFKGFSLQLELYSESLVLSKGYGACDLRVFP
ncbi:F-box/kelch-repeat protein At3g23880-like [Silene latifolia]|uniref:F-box/kelch-repeat protein At3g23880-like n=1 Tax=Silene latifolia TaxID=37657 RepID=UPI003D7819A5